jgi:hypothetical protein
MVEALALGYRGVRAPKSKFWGLAADAAVEGLLDDMLESGAFTPRLLSGCLLGFLRTGGVSAAYGDRWRDPVELLVPGRAPFCPASPDAPALLVAEELVVGRRPAKEWKPVGGRGPWEDWSELRGVMISRRGDATDSSGATKRKKMKDKYDKSLKRPCSRKCAGHTLRKRPMIFSDNEADLDGEMELRFDLEPSCGTKELDECSWIERMLC